MSQPALAQPPGLGGARPPLRDIPACGRWAEPHRRADPGPVVSGACCRALPRQPSEGLCWKFRRTCQGGGQEAFTSIKLVTPPDRPPHVPSRPARGPGAVRGRVGSARTSSPNSFTEHLLCTWTWRPPRPSDPLRKGVMPSLSPHTPHPHPSLPAPPSSQKLVVTACQPWGTVWTL